jgi:dihydroorotate dehydrogenase (NAD+) catalytic subunit
MADLKVELCGIDLRNPVMTASGTFGYGKDYLDFFPLTELGAIVVKGVAVFESHGNPTPRVAEVASGMLNAIGLQGPGIDKFLSHPDYMPFLRNAGTPVIVNVWGRTVEQYAEIAARLDGEDGVAALEVNISCPNVKEGGVAFGTDPVLAREVVAAVRSATSLPLMTKLSPNVSDIAKFAEIVVEAGSDMVSLINTLSGMAIDIETRRPKIANVTGGLSGPAIKPIALRMVHQVARAVDVPVIGMGGISSGEDAVEFLLAGASAVAVGTAIFADPMAPVNVVAGLDAYLEKHGIANVAEIVGAVRL